MAWAETPALSTRQPSSVSVTVSPLCARSCFSTISLCSWGNCKRQLALPATTFRPLPPVSERTLATAPSTGSAGKDRSKSIRPFSQLTMGK